MSVIVFPMSWISSVASACHCPPVSMATGMKMLVLVIPVYFVFLAMAALSAAAWREVLSRWDSAYVSGTVTSQAISLPRCQGINVAPSGRLAPSRDRPTGSLQAGTWAFFIALNIMSLIIAWRMCLGPLFLHARPCRPRVSTLVPHTHVWGDTCWIPVDVPPPLWCLHPTVGDLNKESVLNLASLRHEQHRQLLVFPCRYCCCIESGDSHRFLM